MKKYLMKCPLCKKMFNVGKVAKHIAHQHSDANDNELVTLRDARRYFYSQMQPDQKNHSIHKKNKHYFWSKNDLIPGAPPIKGGLPSLGKKR